MFNFIPLSVPSIKGNEWKYIKDCLDTEWVSSAGNYVNLFEEKICDYTGSKHAIALVNGTSALQLSLKVVGVTAGDEVIVPTLTFIAPVNAVRYLNAQPVFMDSDKYYNINIEKTIDFIEKHTKYVDGFSVNKSTHKKITAIIPVHVFGNAVDIEPLVTICNERNIKVIEDATESLGTRYKKGVIADRHCGTIGKMGCLSFNGNKIITTGGGGMIITDDESFAEKAKYLSTQAKDDKTRYIHNEVGYNFRLTNIQAAIGVAQLEQLPKYLKIKKRIYQIYKKRFADIPGLTVADLPDYAENNRWMTAIQIDDKIYKKNKEELIEYLLQRGIEVRPVWYLNHRQKPYLNCQTHRIEIAEELFINTLTIPSSVNITEDQINSVMMAF